ncbi:MAG TPA: NfeD family protein [Acidimicrobiia bacterium]|nr:NfeD family protein [Acidimicrobiia bacterium]
MRRPLFAFFSLLSVALSWAASAGAGAVPGSAQVAEGAERHMEIVQVEGTIDPVVADLITSSLRRAQTNGASVVILQIDSKGAVDTDPLALIDTVRSSKVPVVAWIGPGKSSAGGAAAALVVAGSFAAASPGADLGPINPLRLDGKSSGDEVLLHEIPGLPPVAGSRLATRFTDLSDRRVSGRKAAEIGLIDIVAPTLGDLIVGLHDKEVPTAAGTVRLSTAKVVTTKDGPRQTADQPVRFIKLGTLASVQHSLTSPSVAFLLLVVGLSLIVFEFFTIGVGLAGMVGAGAVAGAFFGFSHLPVAPWALALVLLSTLGFAIDVQAGHLGFWTAVGVVGLLVGSLGLFDGSSLLNVPLWLVALLFVGQIVFMLGGMTVAVRNRFSIPTVGRDSMIGELGEAHTELNPDGVVTVRGAPWRARTSRGRPVSAGGTVRVVAVDRLVLEVEPGDAPAEV